MRSTQGAAGAAQRAEGERRSSGRTCLRWFSLALASTAIACTPAKPPSVVLISVDTLRADALGAYGGAVPTPTFDRLAAEGALFEKAFAPAPATAPSHATLFTGQTPQRHGVLRNGEPLAETMTTLAEAFQARGYDTAAFVSSFVLDPRFGWGQGFKTFDAVLPEAGSTMGKGRAYPGAFWSAQRFDGFDRRATTTTEAAIRWLETAPEPFFLFVHYFDPHAPYVAPKLFADRTANVRFPLEGRDVPGVAPAQLERLVQNYHGEVLYVDDSLAALLDAVERRTGDTALVVVTSDHGEGLGQHRWLEHAVHLYDEQVRVPLLVRWPGQVPTGRRIATPVELADVAPTVLELAGIESREPRDGRSLVASLTSGAEPPATPLYGIRRLVDENTGWDQGVKLSVRANDWKYIFASESPHELYDLVLDPTERHNVLGSNAERAAELRGQLEAHVAAQPKLHDPAPLSEETRRALQALGYVE
jgi:arylsulfatase A-like enzyme